jgi:hypothetical protein
MRGDPSKLDPPNRGGRLRYADGYLAGASFIDRERFDALIEQCVLVATLGRDRPHKGTRVSGMTPDFGEMAFEIRAAMARACRREIVIIRWPDLTPPEGTPGLGDRLPWVRT